MKRLMMLLAVLSIGYVAGAGLPGVMQAQGGQGREGGVNPNAGRGQAPGGRFTDNPRAARNMFLVTAGPELRAQPGKARLYTTEFQNSQKSHFEWAPEYRLTATTRPGAAVGQEPTTGELHTDNTQIYLVTGGSGTVIVEAEVAPENVYLVAPGEHRGGPFAGGRKVKVKVGDLLSIPPNTWHIGYGDPGVPLQYTIIHIHTRQTIP
jgi:mannose-6-phosphate isomerase-like protein (cupin superfamily)